MAELVISFVIERVGDALIAEAVFLLGVTKQVERMQAELKRMQCFLKDADAKKDGDQRVSNRVSEIRDLAYHAEDVIDTFIIKVASKRRDGLEAFLKRYACIFTESVEHHKIGAKIEDIYTRIQDITNNLQIYGVRNIDEGEGSSNAYQRQHRLRRSYPHFKEEDVIGLEEDTNKMVEELIREEERYRVVSIVGMGGLGKTTLAKEVYNHRRVKIGFDCYSWVYVSQEFKPKDIFTSILKNVSSLDGETVEKMKDEELVEKVYEILKDKRYLIVLDDIWSEDAWYTLKPAFPNGKMGSKILLTTRNKKVALHADPWSLPCEPRSLTDDESWELLCKKAFPEDVVTSYGGLAPSFEKLGREMVSRCDNLPLAIVVLGGLLATKGSLKEWELVHRHITGHLSEGQQQRRVMDILGISYHDLPSHLKPCFLYLGLFPEDFQIPAKKLIRLWVAEGFIPKPPPPSQEGDEEETMEDVAQKWLAELGHRCMIQISKRSSTGSIKSCHVHDLMRDLCLSKAREEKFLEFIFPRKSLESDGSSMAVKSRRTAIHFGSNERYVSFKKVDPNVRSLLVFHSGNDLACLKTAQVKSIYKNFHLLRVLDLEGVRISGGTMPKEIGNLINLRYLSLRYTEVNELPSSLGNLRNLQTLDIWTCYFINVTVPNVIWKLDKLRHLMLPFVGNHDLRLDTLSGLQTLKRVPGKFWTGKGATQLTNLKNLKIFPIGSSEEADAFLESPVIRLDRLESLYLGLEAFYAENFPTTFPNLKQLSSCHNLSELFLGGKISKHAQVNFFPPNLTKLTLSHSRLDQDPMAAMGNLLNLRILKIKGNAYIGKEMVCTVKSFPNLDCLRLVGLREVEEWKLEEGAMPCLRRLVIHSCRKLKMMPEGLKFIAALQELDIAYMPKAFVNKIRVVEGKGGKDLYKVQHITFIKIKYEEEAEEE